MYKTFNHAKTRILYHIIFSTKYRRNCLDEIKTPLYEYLKLSEENFKIKEMKVDRNHIHFMIQAKPSKTISTIVKRLKQYSTFYAWKNHRTHMKNNYWGTRHRLWTRGYFVCTIGEAGEETIKKYIENQG